MKKNNITKTLIMLLVLFLILISTTTVYAEDKTKKIPTPIDSIMKKVQSPDPEIIDSGSTISGKILYIVQLVGTIIAISMLMVLGIKYMMAAPEGKANIKKQAYIYIVGAVLLFGAVGIVEVIKNFETNI